MDVVASRKGTTTICIEGHQARVIVITTIMVMVAMAATMYIERH